jgi:hypothetical protein
LTELLAELSAFKAALLVMPWREEEMLAVPIVPARVCAPAVSAHELRSKINHVFLIRDPKIGSDWEFLSTD